MPILPRGGRIEKFLDFGFFCYPIPIMLNALLTEKPLTLLKRYWLVLAFLVIVLLGVFMYVFGLRLTGSGFVQAGTLSIVGLPDGTAVYTDQSRMTAARGGRAEVDLLPGGHTVIVDAPNMQPWNELFMVEAGKSTVLAPLLVPKTPVANRLTGEERALGAEAILNYPLPTKAAPLPLSSGCALVYVSNNRILAEGISTETCTVPEYLLCPIEEGGARTEVCPSATVIFPPNENIESVSPFPGRDDALIVAAGSQAYVVELDPRAPQFFAPIMKGPRVRSAPWNDSSVVISDTAQVYQLFLVQ